MITAYTYNFTLLRVPLFRLRLVLIWLLGPTSQNKQQKFSQLKTTSSSVICTTEQKHLKPCFSFQLELETKSQPLCPCHLFRIYTKTAIGRKYLANRFRPSPLPHTQPLPSEHSRRPAASRPRSRAARARRRPDPSDRHLPPPDPPLP